MMEKKIKTITAYRFDYMPGDEENEEVQLDGYKTASEEFDSNHKLLKEVTYDENEEIEQVYVYKYNENGFLTEETLYYDTEEIVNRKTYTLNDKGLIIKEIVYYSETEKDTIEYKYNDIDQILEKVHQNQEGVIESTEKFVYFNNNLVENSVYDAENKLTSQKLHKFDEKGREIEYINNDLVEDIRFTKEYTYDEQGRRIESLTYNDNNQLTEKQLVEYATGNKPSQIIEETAFRKSTTRFTYDERGNLILQEEYNRKEELVSKINRVFDENNLLLESDIVINSMKDDIGMHYLMKNEYSFF